MFYVVNLDTQEAVCETGNLPLALKNAADQTRRHSHPHGVYLFVLDADGHVTVRHLLHSYLPESAVAPVTAKCRPRRRYKLAA